MLVCTKLKTVSPVHAQNCVGMNKIEDCVGMHKMLLVCTKLLACTKLKIALEPWEAKVRANLDPDHLHAAGTPWEEAQTISDYRHW